MSTPAAILSAYTGILMCDFSEMVEYISEVEGEPVWDIQLANEEFVKQMKEKIMERGDFTRAMNALNTLGDLDD